ncbi:MAG TPA: alpha/beta hydrolase [Acidobacteriaceae bacterium]|nr:alpha/beta hydrolase [Acidobacteriaceae bacterium]
MKDAFFTTSDGVRLHYLIGGSGQIVLFIPGWTMPAEIWQRQIEHFSPDYCVVALDPRSQGSSDKPEEGNYPARRAQDYKELIDHLGSPVVLVAWSIAVYEAMTYVEIFGTHQWKGLVLVDIMLHDPSIPEDRARRYEFLHSLQADRKQFAATFIRSMYRRPQPEKYLEGIIAASLHTPTNSAVALLAELAVKNDIRPALTKIKIPVLAAMTPRNRLAAELVTAMVPDSQAEIFENAGHCLFVDEADRFNSLLKGFLEKLAR